MFICCLVLVFVCMSVSAKLKQMPISGKYLSSLCAFNFFFWFSLIISVLLPIFCGFTSDIGVSAFVASMEVSHIYFP